MSLISNLDDSYATAITNMSITSMSSPENLGKVVDVQLREQILRYDNLLDKYNQSEQEKSRLNEQIEQQTHNINALQSKCRQIKNENSTNIKRYEAKLQELAALSKQLQNLKSNNIRTNELEGDLKVALSDLQSKIQECQQAQDIHKQLANYNKILLTKLNNHREMSSLRENQWQKERTILQERSDNLIKKNRSELEGKLIKMKKKMNYIYSEETSKARKKHEKQERELSFYKMETQQLVEKNEKYDSHLRSISMELSQLNSQNLDLKKDNEFLKNKLRLAESRLFSGANFGLNCKMEDEGKTYLTDRKTGVSRTSPIGRESIRHLGLNMRNPLGARRLRNVYAVQHGDQN